MAGAFVTSELEGLEPVLRRINALAAPRRLAQGLAHVGALIESQTKGRFDERRSPDGEPWAPWSPAYAKTRRKGQTLLVSSGALRDDIAWELTEDELAVGSGLVYAAIHQAGGTDDMPAGPAAIPARPYLGLSAADAKEVDDAIAEWIEGLLH